MKARRSVRAQNSIYLINCLLYQLIPVPYLIIDFWKYFFVLQISILKHYVTLKCYNEKQKKKKKWNVCHIPIQRIYEDVCINMQIIVRLLSSAKTIMSSTKKYI